MLIVGYSVLYVWEEFFDLWIQLKFVTREVMGNQFSHHEFFSLHEAFSWNK